LVNKERLLRRMKLYQKENYPRLLKYWRKYHKEHPEIGREKCRRRRARKLSQLGDFSAWMVQYYRCYQRNECFYCGEKLSTGVRNGNPRKETLDHVIPLSKGGLHCWTNTVLACRGCNCKKQDKMGVSA
jgi:5-methylcytosine-specific restriction endonuclease McrA